MFRLVAPSDEVGGGVSIQPPRTQQSWEGKRRGRAHTGSQHAPDAPQCHTCHAAPARPPQVRSTRQLRQPGLGPWSTTRRGPGCLSPCMTGQYWLCHGCIGRCQHHRWATYVRPTVRLAHVHKSGEISHTQWYVAPSPSQGVRGTWLS